MLHFRRLSWISSAIHRPSTRTRCSRRLSLPPEATQSMMFPSRLPQGICQGIAVFLYGVNSSQHAFLGDLTVGYGEDSQAYDDVELPKSARMCLSSSVVPCGRATDRTTTLVKVQKLLGSNMSLIMTASQLRQVYRMPASFGMIGIISKDQRMGVYYPGHKITNSVYRPKNSIPARHPNLQTSSITDLARSAGRLEPQTTTSVISSHPNIQFHRCCGRQPGFARDCILPLKD
ncbi:hypothetical protein BDY19DRAFT_13629 [Irpex rosettiformis]|uniref:Uncharacterized protein n=1 Tax=Irpex rosettiformis TaxID=378272 RepID=A0ACB8UIW1_9APHY|nr:hypothetical protein BDY19DRAFT_13629 [Irpex rosettiformis]